ncbi:hypothetical protein DV515_00005850, partial [Chloebia gouldiae]
MNKPRESLQPGYSLPHHTLMDPLSCSQKSKDEKGAVCHPALLHQYKSCHNRDF